MHIEKHILIEIIQDIINHLSEDIKEIKEEDNKDNYMERIIHIDCLKDEITFVSLPNDLFNYDIKQFEYVLDLYFSKD